MPAAYFSLNCFYKDYIVLLCSDYTVTSFCFLTIRFFFITVFDIIAVIFLSLAILIVGKILSYLKLQPAEYCAY